MNKNRCTKKQNGKFEIVVGGQVIRKNSARAFTTAYDFGGGYVRLSNDSQLRRLRGEPTVIHLENEVEPPEWFPADRDHRYFVSLLQSDEDQRRAKLNQNGGKQ